MTTKIDAAHWHISYICDVDNSRLFDTHLELPSHDKFKMVGEFRAGLQFPSPS